MCKAFPVSLRKNVHSFGNEFFAFWKDAITFTQEVVQFVLFPKCILQRRNLCQALLMRFLKWILWLLFTLNTDIWTAGGLPMSRPGPQRHQQCLPVQGGLPAGNTLLDLHHGTPPL